MRHFVRCAALVLLVVASPVAADPGVTGHRGWGWLVDRLAADGVDRAQVERAFDDPRIDPFDGLDFGLAPHESRGLYRSFLRPGGIAAARSCRMRYARELDAAAAAERVPASVIAAIISVESGCGQHTGGYVILERLARLAMANEPANLDRNLARLAPSGDGPVAARVRARARYLDDTFYPEVRAVFTLAARLGTDPVAIRGSGSGAFGTPQFLPTSYLTHGADGDADGRVDLYDPADAALSCACYLAGSGWRPGLSSAGQRRALWAYNRSDAYIDTVLALARAIDRPAPPRTRTATRPAHRPAASRTVQAKVKRAPQGRNLSVSSLRP